MPIAATCTGLVRFRQWLPEGSGLNPGDDHVTGTGAYIPERFER
jgi:hypothetical protein